MSDFLQTMAILSADRAATAGRFSSADLDKPLVPLRLTDFDVIAEIKDRSPAEGDLATRDSDRGARARKYTAGGAAAVSVLTEPSKFSGSLKHLEEVVAAVPSDAILREMLDCADEHGMFVLLESFDSDDLARVSGLLDNTKYQQRAEGGQLLFGVNTRNLRTLHVDPDRLAKLAAVLPAGHCVAESGLHDANDAANVAELGYRLALVGTALMRSDDPASLIAAMREAGSARIAA